MTKNTISVSEASRLLGVRLDYVYRLLWGSTLDGAKNDGVWKIKLDSVQAYLGRRQSRVRKNVLVQAANVHPRIQEVRQ